MKNSLFIVCFFFFIVLCAQESPYGIVIHGGAGTIKKENLSAEMEKAYTTALTEAIQIGHSILAEGGSSQEAVEQTIRYMEDSPLFNAGKGAVLTADGEVTLDASFMHGGSLDAGAVAGAMHIKNPISSAIAVMEKSPHVMLSGKGADVFAQSVGLDAVPNSYFITERRKKALERVQARQGKKTASFFDETIQNSKYGTVGCVALDKQGNLSAGTSTGGMTNKKWGRIGDAPVIGAGTYANNASCGISATGWGEYFIRVAVAHDIAALVAYKKMDVITAAKQVLAKVARLGGDGGVIVLDSKGNVAMEFNTSGMYRAHMNQEGKLTVGIYGDSSPLTEDK